MRKARVILSALSVVVAVLSGGYAMAQHQFGQAPKSYGVMSNVQGIGVQVNPTWPLQVDPTLTANGGAGKAVSVSPTLKAKANSDTLSAVYINPTFNDTAHSGVTHYAVNAVGTVKATTFSGSGASLTSIPASAVDWTTPGTIGSGTPNSGAFTTLSSTGTNTFGTGGTAFTAMGVCTIASTTITNTAANQTCTGVPASAAVAVTCTGNAAFSTANATSIYCRATGTVNQLACTTTLANTTAMAYSCSWIQP